MKIARKILLGLLILIVVIVGGGYVWLQAAYPSVGAAPDIRVDITPERIARGEYLATHVAVCVDCHSTRDFSKYAGPVIEGTVGKGGERYGEEMGLPGTFYAPNITPFKLQDWTDGEIYRAITAGVSKDGRPLFPLMPYLDYGKMDKEDIYSIIAYVRSLEPIEYTPPASDPNFPMNLIMRTIPGNPKHEYRPSPADKVTYGRYVASAAGCAHCHTPSEKGEPVPGKEFAGGAEMALPMGTLRSANLTPDKETGLGNWTEQMFIQRFRVYSDSGYVEPVLGPKDFNTIMPWRQYAGMSDEDLGAIYAYLRTVKPVRNSVERFTPAK
jgi:mono/diheme cytochrome c family protein